MRIVVDGDKRYRQIIGFTSIDPNTVVGMYEGSSGYVATKEEAVDIRGPSGAMVADPDQEIVEVEGPPGKSAYQLWLDDGHSGTEADYLAWTVGPAPGQAAVDAAAAAYLADHPPAKGDKGDAGQTVTLDEVAAIVSAYMVSNPPESGDKGDKGDPGQNATLDQVQAAVNTYLMQNPVPAGQNATDGQVADAVASYLQSHPVATVKGDKGDKGDPGTNGTNGTNGVNGLNASDLQVATAVAAYLAMYPPARGEQGLKGDKGNTGDPGTNGLPGTTFLRQVNVTDTALIALGLGDVDIRYPCVGAVVGKRYLAFIRTYKINNAVSVTLGRPALYYIIDCYCAVVDTINVLHRRPAIVLGGKYELFTDIVEIP